MIMITAMTSFCFILTDLGLPGFSASQECRSGRRNELGLKRERERGR